jgi:hypothetical protein
MAICGCQLPYIIPVWIDRKCLDNAPHRKAHSPDRRLPVEDVRVRSDSVERDHRLCPEFCQGIINQAHAANNGASPARPIPSSHRWQAEEVRAGPRDRLRCSRSAQVFATFIAMVRTLTRHINSIRRWPKYRRQNTSLGFDRFFRRGRSHITPGKPLSGERGSPRYSHSAASARAT